MATLVPFDAHISPRRSSQDTLSAGSDFVTYGFFRTIFERSNWGRIFTSILSHSNSFTFMIDSHVSLTILGVHTERIEQVPNEAENKASPSTEPTKKDDLDPVSPELVEPTETAEDWKAKLEDQENKYKYLYAEFENFKKRAVKEKSEARKYGWESVARDLLDVIDNLDRALSYAPQDKGNSLLQGIQMVRKQFLDLLEKNGVTLVESIHQEFDPNVHEAVGQEFSEKVKENHIVREEAKGYLLNERLLRPSQVIVSQGPEGSAN